MGQVALFQTGNGLAEGPALLLIAVGLAIVLFPVRRLLRVILDR